MTHRDVTLLVEQPARDLLGELDRLGLLREQPMLPDLPIVPPSPRMTPATSGVQFTLRLSSNAER